MSCGLAHVAQEVHNCQLTAPDDRNIARELGVQYANRLLVLPSRLISYLDSQTYIPNSISVEHYDFEGID